MWGKFVRGRLRALILFPQMKNASPVYGQSEDSRFPLGKIYSRTIVCPDALAPMQNESPLCGQNKNPHFFYQGESSRTRQRAHWRVDSLANLGKQAHN